MISVRLNKEDECIVREYAKLHSVSISELFRMAVLERIENSLDLMAHYEDYDEFERSQSVYSPDGEKEIFH